MPWRRPPSVPQQVWLQFQGRSRDGQPGQMFQVRDVRPQDREACIDLMLHAFLNDEPLCKALDLKSDPVSRATVKKDWEAFVDQGISLACFTEEDGQPKDLVGFNILVVKQREDQESLYGEEGAAWWKLLKTLEVAESLVNVFDHYGVDAYLTSSGLTVKPEYRGQNIGARLFDARKPLCRALGLTVSATVFTAKTSQALAVKCGYQLLGTLHYKDMKKHGVELTHPVIEVNSTAELRGIRFLFHD
ncbi:hypothetical protein O0L34_g12043 [Tuta absoluta]|nr:hypothetical protein O0L34_g12043 [Tuta absoluta]